MFAKIKAGLELFQKGKAVANPEAWKNRTITANMLAAFMMAVVALAAAFGYDVKVGMEDAEAIAAAVIAVFGAVNSVMHIITSNRVGYTPISGSETAPTAFPAITASPEQAGVQESAEAPSKASDKGANNVPVESTAKKPSTAKRIADESVRRLER